MKSYWTHIAWWADSLVQPVVTTVKFSVATNFVHLTQLLSWSSLIGVKGGEYNWIGADLFIFDVWATDERLRMMSF